MPIREHNKGGSTDLAALVKWSAAILFLVCCIAEPRLAVMLAVLFLVFC